MNSSQKNLYSLAREAEENNDLFQAKQYYYEALRIGHESQIICDLCNLYLYKENQSDQAYALIKEEPDLFSDPKIFELYLEILKKQHYLIEKLELEHLLKRPIDIEISPVDEQHQLKLMENFNKTKKLTEFEYLKLFSLSKENFVSFAQSLLMNPSQNFALRLSLCEDLIKLGIDQEINIRILGENKKFIPAETTLLQKDIIYQEVCSSIGDYCRRDPSKLPLLLGEINISLGMLFPRLHDYISNPDQFAHDFRSYLDFKKGYTNQELLDKIYHFSQLESLDN